MNNDTYQKVALMCHTAVCHVKRNKTTTTTKKKKKTKKKKNEEEEKRLYTIAAGITIWRCP